MLIRTQDKVPEYYVNESRDFQVLCRGYDTLFNMMKFDTDSFNKLLSASNIRSNLLPLLQTKVGFFTNAILDDESLRLILGTFLYVIKNKGSMLAVEQVINVWLKSIHLETSVHVDTFDNDGYIGQTPVPAGTVAIGIEGEIRDYTALKEYLKYVLPAGYTLYFYFYTLFDVKGHPKIGELHEKATLVFVSDDINSVVRNSDADSVMHGTSSIALVEGNTQGRIFTSPISTAPYNSAIEKLEVFDSVVLENPNPDVPPEPDEENPDGE